MQNVFNTVKSKALGVAEYLTPVLKVVLLLLKLFIRFFFRHTLLTVYGVGPYHTSHVLSGFWCLAWHCENFFDLFFILKP